MAFISILPFKDLVTIAVGVSLLIFAHLVLFPTKSCKEDVPLVPGGYPFLGHTIQYMRDASRMSFKNKARLGPIFAFNFGGTRYNVLSDVVSGTLSFTITHGKFIDQISRN